MENILPTTPILIADDDAPTRMLLRATLSQWGYVVLEATDGLDAIEKLKQATSPMLVIVDWMMPKLDGLSFCKRVKTEFAQPPYIILLTSFTGTTQVIKALDAGADEFLAKPFNPAELHSRLRAGLRILGYEYNKKTTFLESLSMDDPIIAQLMAIKDEFETGLINISHKTSKKAAGETSPTAELALLIQLRQKLTCVIEQMEKTIRK